MAEHVLTGGLLLFDGLDLSNYAKSVVLDYSADAKDSTCLGHTTRRRKGGLKDVALGAAGFFEAAEPDATLFADVGASDKIVTACATQNLGDVAFFFKSLLGEYQPFGADVGELAGFRLSAGCSGTKLVRGTLMELSTQTSTANGTGRQLGAASASQTIFAALHVLAASGAAPTLDLKIQSDDNAGFTSATDRITFTQASAVGSQFGSLAGAITDDYWRAVWTIGGGTPSFRFSVAVGIQTTA